ncbi:hypothetical protein D3C77_672860 [compost metagenome]
MLKVVPRNLRQLLIKALDGLPDRSVFECLAVLHLPPPVVRQPDNQYGYSPYTEQQSL